MSNQITNIDNLDISNPNLNLNDYVGKSFKYQIRDTFDYIVRRNLYYFKYKNFFKKQNYSINLVLPSRGFSDFERKKKLNSIKNIKGKKILCIGCGNGFELLSWLKYKPSYIKAIDIFNYSKSWGKVLKFISEKNLSSKIEFFQKGVLDIDQTEQFDFIVSDAVFEHLVELEKVILHCSKLIKDDGIIYASYGPLWYTYGGDHFSGRDKKENGFNHLLLSKKNYLEYFEKNVGSIDYEIKKKGSGGFFVKEELFSKKNGNEYMDIFRQNNLISNYTVVEFCPIAYKLILKNKKIRDELLYKYPSMQIEDYYLKSHIIYLKKNFLSK